MVTNTMLSARLRPCIQALLAIVLVAATLVVGARPVLAADKDLVVDGAGWGHGVGLSQWGAYGMSVEGASYQGILGHFYTNATIGTLGAGALDPAPPLWVNLEMDFETLTLRVDAISGSGAPVTVTRGPTAWTVPVGSTIEVRGPTDCSLYIDPPGADDAFETGKGGCSFDFWWYAWNTGASPTTKVAIVGCTQADWNVVPMMQRECQYGRGMLHVRGGPGGLDLSARMKLDDYVLGISEMPYYWGSSGGMAALKAQAVAARSYARELQIHRGPPGNNSCGAWCHVRDTTWDQRYVGWGHGQANWITAANSTAGQVVTHPDAPNNGVVRAYYASSTGGHTESIQEIWTGWDAREYYQSVDDHWSIDGTVANPSASWTVTIGHAELAAALGMSTVTSAAVTKRNTSGSAATLAFGDGSTTVTKPASWLKDVFGLKSIYYDLRMTEASPDNPLVGPFTDVYGSVHAADILAIYERGITKGCNPPANDRYCPQDTLTRGQMAAFLKRAFDLPPASKDYFSDDNGSIFESDINRLAEAQITMGCSETAFCPDDPITREQMAAFLDRAFGYTDGTGTDYFIDDNGSIFEESIDRIAAAGVTLGCNPPVNDRFCPKDHVSREQMASFIERALRYAGM